ncbi:hypothetical protein LK533_07455 [Sphingomonas sp. PL-96]|uniref:hypothetical protein n=1 Tax=Sphingomonas sp. PL-96 TaxID=2887201 RepID=UPI001E461997|nr:hypothetical protein [Sphingomonas sp. PL-96]MCC2976509.1 hypothetical protein [Sphingomonas sp. PL-96]
MGRFRFAAVVLLALWAVSLWLPVIAGPDPAKHFPGWSILILGVLGFTVGKFGWFANLIIVPAWLWILVRPASQAGRQHSMRRGVAAMLTLLGVDALFWRDMYGDNGAIPIEAFGAGYYLWLISVFGTAALLWVAPRPNASPSAVME